MGLNDLVETEAFLNILHSCQHDKIAAGVSLRETLQQALYIDGYVLHKLDIQRSLRGLAESSESSGGGVNVTALLMVGLCILCAGFASGLTQGLLSLDSMEMEIKARSGTPEEKKYASKLIPIITRHHLLLVTLMLWNASATEALPIFLSALVPEWVAIIISVTLVLFVGEIIPASILTGPKQLQITASLTPLVYFVLVIFFPIAYPIALCLDRIIGHADMTMYNRTEISTMMQLHREEGVKRAGAGGGGHGRESGDMYEEEEVVIIAGALKYREMAVSQVMTPAREAYMISINEKLSYKLVYDIFKAGYSRIPVYEKDKDDVVGLVLAKDLIFIDPEDETPVRSFLSLFGRKPAVVWHDSKLGETLSMFKSERSHMAIVRDVECEGEGDPYYKVVGIITLEDIVEEILGTEIEDETDVKEEEEEVLEAQSQARDPELARLRTMANATVLSQSLTDEEVHSIGIYLFTNVPQIQRMFKDHMADLQKLVRSSAVITMSRHANASDKPSQEDYLYRAGKMNNTCTLILNGSVEVVEQSRDKVQVKGPWSTIAPEALDSTEGTYVPTFSAYVVSETVRFLCITSHASKAVVDASDGSPPLQPHHHRHHLHGKGASMYNMSVPESKENTPSSSTAGAAGAGAGVKKGFNTITYSVVPNTTRTNAHLPGSDTLSSAESPLHNLASPNPSPAGAGLAMPMRKASWTVNRSKAAYTPSSALNSVGFETYGTVAASKGGYASVGDEADGTRNPLLNPSNFRAPPAFPAPPVPQSSASAPATTPSTGSATASTAASGKVSSSSKPSKPPPGAKPKGVTIAAEPSRREVDTASYSPLSIEGDLLDMDLDLHSADETPVSTSAKPTSESAFTGFDA